MPKYIIADPDAGCGWSHIWRVTEDGSASIDVERACRFVLDRKALRFLQVDIDVDGMMVPATPVETEDLLDSLINGNPDLIDDPGSWELAVSDLLPGWCKKARRARTSLARGAARRPREVPGLLRLMTEVVDGFTTEIPVASPTNGPSI